MLVIEKKTKFKQKYDTIDELNLANYQSTLFYNQTDCVMINGSDCTRRSVFYWLNCTHRIRVYFKN